MHARSLSRSLAEGRPAQKKTLAHLAIASPPLTTKPLHFSCFLSHSLEVRKVRNSAGCDTRCLLEPYLHSSRPASLFPHPRSSAASAKGSRSSPRPTRNEEQVCIQPWRISKEGGIRRSKEFPEKFKPHRSLLFHLQKTIFPYIRGQKCFSCKDCIINISGFLWFFSQVLSFALDRQKRHKQG